MNTKEIAAWCRIILAFGIMVSSVMMHVTAFERLALLGIAMLLYASAEN